MGMDYIILNNNCPVMAKYGSNEVFGKVKLRAIHENLNILMKSQGVTSPDKLKPIIMITGGQQREMHPTDLAKEVKELEKWGKDCRNCPANIPTTNLFNPNNTFGCIGYIGYPISKMGERLVANAIELIRDMGQLNGNPGAIIQMTLEWKDTDGYQIDGKITNGLRPKIREQDGSPEYFEWPEPMWVDLKDGRKISTSHVFDYLFETHQVKPEYVEMIVNPFFGYYELAFNKLPEQAKALFSKDKTVIDMLQFANAINTAKTIRNGMFWKT